MKAIDYNDKKQQQKIRHIFHAMDLCGCGTPGQYAIIHAMLECSATFHSGVDPNTVPSFYNPMNDIPGNAVELIAKVMDSSSWGLLEHGCSIGGASLTERGKALLHFFRTFGDDTDAWPEWWCSCEAGDKW